MGVEAKERPKALGAGGDRSEKGNAQMTAVTKDKSLWDHGDAAYKRVIEETLRRYNGAVTKAAAALGITRVTLWRKMKAYGIKAVRVKSPKSPKTNS